MSKFTFAALASLMTMGGGALWTQLRGSEAPPVTGDVVVWTAADQARLEESISEIEERLLGSQARVGLWDELRARHEGVSAVACANLAEHAVAMEKRGVRPPTLQARRAPAAQTRVATGGPVVEE